MTCGKKTEYHSFQINTYLFSTRKIEGIALKKGSDVILERLNLGAKLWLAPAITLALLIAIAFGGYSVMRKQQGTLDEWVNVRNPNMLAAIDVYRKTKEIHAASYQLLAWTQANYSENQVNKLRESIVQEGLEVQTKAKALAERPGLNTDEAEIARKLVSKVAKFVKAVAPVVDMADTDQSVATTLMIKAEAPYADLREQLDALSALQTATMAASAIDSSSFFVRISMAGALTSLVCLLIATFVTFAVHRSILGSVLNIRNAALRLKNRDLSFQPVVTGQDEVALTASLMAETVTALRETIGAIHISAGQMDVAISEIASGNNDLSVRTESQAANLQQTKEDMLRLSEMVNVNADSARSASDLAMRTRQRSEQGGQMMGQVVEVMGAITESSKKVHDIIAVINDIAFQTNILALNAAVEAARAGDQGRGFAVVASEVRTLSQRSAEAASAIRQLITHSADRVADGGVLVANTGSAMEQMVVEIRTLSELIDTISRANDDQSQSMKSVTATLDALDQVTQKNAALVEHSAATASTMREESGHLLSAVGTFNLDAAPVTRLLA